MLQPLRETLLRETTEFSFVHRPPVAHGHGFLGNEIFLVAVEDQQLLCHTSPSFRSHHRGQGHAFLINHRSFDSLYRVQNSARLVSRKSRGFFTELFPLKNDFEKMEKGNGKMLVLVASYSINL